MESFSKFFGFNEEPFKRTPDVEFYYPTKIHEEALDTLRYSLESGEPFAVLTGEPGTGKTMTIRKFISELPDNIVVAYILFPNLTPTELFMAILEDFKVKADEELTKNALFSKFRDFLVEIKEAGKKAIIIIDEAQNLPAETLEELRILSNLETEKEKLLKIILAGQPELITKLDSDEFRQLKQRITLYAYLSNIPESEIKNYINSHLIKAGRSSIRVQSRVVRGIAKVTKGNPRLINTLMERTMVAAFLDNSYTVTEEHLSSAIASVNTIMSTLRRKRSMKYIKILSIAAVAAVFAIGVFGVFSYIGGMYYRLGLNSQPEVASIQENVATPQQRQHQQSTPPTQQTETTVAVNDNTESQNNIASGNTNNTVSQPQQVASQETNTADQSPLFQQNNNQENNVAVNNNQVAQNQVTQNTVSQNQVAQNTNIDIPPTRITEESRSNDYFTTPPQQNNTTVTQNVVTESNTNTITPPQVANNTTATPPSQPVGTILPGTLIMIEANTLNVREMPDINGTRLTSVYKGQRFYVLSDSQDWVRIRINANLNGWVFKPHIRVLQ